MRRREKSAPAASSELPDDLAAGPCIEDWAVRGERSPWMSARRAWNAAVDEWAADHGYGVRGRPLMNARNLARTRHPWSRATTKRKRTTQ